MSAVTIIGIFYIFIYISIMIGVMIGFGFATRAIIHNKGYRENWFWWGFFFGMIAIIVALTKPDVHSREFSYGKDYGGEPSALDKLSGYSMNNKSSGNTWTCRCGRVNPNYVGTCSCGYSKHNLKMDIAKKEKALEEKKALESKKAVMDIAGENLDILRKLKELLDIGAITEDEYNIKKSQLLNIGVMDNAEYAVMQEAIPAEEPVAEETTQTIDVNGQLYEVDSHAYYPPGYCFSCGFQNPAGSVFCVKCGNRL